ncbi:hypothetical protein SAMN04488009_1245 [Maribacter sedimenticola]|uniref:DUF4398 domain-containing protein n=1 Tax=Maribacter sedimenticola TaxID=228956 RepID=A0ABY1SEL6_9FLAO|nr:hypothetical protein [Maribacter sedimenticola]SNR31862.1 hypothetical protein SAMN04488009_1245 [Maribacter sedimenticola]
MKKYAYIFCTSCILLLSSFSSNLDCEYANSNMAFAKARIVEALQTEDINKARFYSYKALNVLEKSKMQLDQCGCTLAREKMEENLENLIAATKSTTLIGTQNFLKKSLSITEDTMVVLAEHNTHNSIYTNDLLAMNTNVKPTEHKIPTVVKEPSSLTEKIDQSLEKYRTSLNKVVETVDCKEAYVFAKRIFDECEQQLLKTDLSYGSKYYNLRTKEITQQALNKLGNCAKIVESK